MSGRGFRGNIAAIAEAWSWLATPAAFEPGPCWEWPGSRTPQGYGMTKRNGENLAHRAAWVEVGLVLEDGVWVLHRCDNPPCFRPSHLYPGTPADNSRDMVARGRSRRVYNEQHHATKLPTELVHVIRQRVAAGEKQRVIAEEFAISTGHVSRLCSGKRRSHA